MSILIGVAFAAILGALACAGVVMLRGGRAAGSKGGDMMRALAVRIGRLGGALRLHPAVAWWLGWIHPTGMPLGR